MLALTGGDIFKVDDLSHLLVVYGVIAGLILVRIATFTANRVSRSETTHVPINQWLWLAIFFFLIIQSWWALFPWFSLQYFTITFMGYSTIIFTPLLVYLATVLITPHHDESWKITDQNFFQCKLRPLYLLCIIALLMESVLTALIYQLPNNQRPFIESLFATPSLVRFGSAIFLGIFLLIPRNHKAHLFLPGALLIALVLFVVKFQNITLMKYDPPPKAPESLSLSPGN